MVAYLAGSVVGMSAGKRLSGLFGRRNLFLLMILLFTVCSFFCGNASGLQGLIIFRFLQGTGGGGMLMLSYNVIIESWPTPKRVIAQVFVVLGMLAGKVLAPPFAGYITDNYSWPYVFFANIPAGAAAALFILIFVRNGPYEKATN